MSVTTDAYGYKDYAKASGDRGIYLNSVTGNDGTAVVNDPTKPYRNISTAYSQLRNGFGDRIRAARGSNFQDQNFPFWQKSGRSAIEPMMISAYTPPGGADSDPMPIFGNPLSGTPDTDTQPGLFVANGGGDYVVFDSIHWKASVANTGYGIFWRSAGTDVLFQDCKFEGFHYGGGFVCNVAESLVIRRVTFFGCTWYHNYDTVSSLPTRGHNEGLYFSSGKESAQFIKCIFVENGSPDTLSHSAYVDDVRAAGHPCDFLWEECWFLNDTGASHALQLRPGGTVRRCVFLRTAIALQMGTGGIDSGGTDMDPINPSVGLVSNVSQCLFAEGRNIGSLDGTDPSGQPRGWGLLTRWCYSGTIEDNLFIDGTGGGDSYAITLQNDDGTEQNRGGNRNLLIHANVIYNWGAAVFIQGVSPKTVNNSFTNNVIQLISGSKTVFTYQGAINGQITSSANVIFASGSTASTVGRILYNSDLNSLSYNSFMVLIGDTGSTYSQVTFTDPNASSLTFLQASGVSGVTTKNQAYAWLRDALVAHRRYNLNPLLTSTVPYLDHHRIKFDMLAIGDEGGTLLPPTAAVGAPQTLTDSDRSGDQSITLDLTGSSAVFPASITNYSVSEAKSSLYSGTSDMPSVTMTGFGNHTHDIVVTDSNGLQSTQVSVVNRLNPTTVTGFSVVKDHESATTSVSAYPGMDTYQFRLGLTTSYNVFGSQSDPSNLFTGLAAGTTYHWAARGGGNGVFGPWSADQTFTTDSLPTNLPPSAEAGPAQSLTDTNRSGDESFTFDFSGSAPVAPATITNYLLKQGTTTIYSGTSSGPSATLGLGLNSLTLTVTDSNSLTAQDTVNMTLSPNTPVGMAVASITDTSAVTSVTTYPGTGVTYTHAIKKVGDTSFTTYSGVPNNRLWTGLDPDTDYVYKARVNAGGVSGAYSAEQAFRTSVAEVVDGETNSVLDDNIRNALVRRGRILCYPFVDNRGDFPLTSPGMQESLQWPVSPQFVLGQSEMCYRYIPGPPGNAFSTDLKTLIANFEADYAPHIDAWLTAWGMPPDYTGWIAEDLEDLSEFAMVPYNGASNYENLALAYPHWAWPEAFQHWLNLLYTKIREVRPLAAGIARYGLGDLNPNFFQWDWNGPDNQYRNRTEILRQANRYGNLFRPAQLNGVVPMCVFYDVYWDQGWTRLQRKEILLRQHEVHLAMFGKQFYRSAFALLPVRSVRASIKGQAMPIADMREIWTDAMALGYRHFGFWDALEGPTERDIAQGVINNVIAPLLVELGGRYTGFATA